MQKIQPKSTADYDLFCPWDDDREMELVGISSALPDNQKEQKHADSAFRTKKAEKEQPTRAIQEEAKKTLLHIEEHDKSKKMQLLKDYVDRKKEMRKKENELPEGLSQFKLPPINHRKHTLNLKHSSKKLLEEAMSQLVDHPGSAENEEEHIFRKYGEHKKKLKGSSVERSYSLGHQPFKIQHQASESKKKYQTLDASTVREKKSMELQLGDLKLKGKKYSCDSRNPTSRKLDLMSYVPTQPNITPHYMLFGHNKEEVLKKVLQQLHHKFKQLN